MASTHRPEREIENRQRKRGPLLERMPLGHFETSGGIRSAAETRPGSTCWRELLLLYELCGRRQFSILQHSSLFRENIYVFCFTITISQSTGKTKNSPFDHLRVFAYSSLALSISERFKRLMKSLNVETSCDYRLVEINKITLQCLTVFPLSISVAIAIDELEQLTVLKMEYHQGGHVFKTNFSPSWRTGF